MYGIQFCDVHDYGEARLSSSNNVTEALYNADKYHFYALEMVRARRIAQQMDPKDEDEGRAPPARDGLGKDEL